MRRRRALLVSCASAGALLVAGCGGGASPPRRLARSRTVDVYSSLPLHGSERAESLAIESGIELALGRAHDRAGGWIVRYRPLDDATARAGGWTTAQTEAGASRAATDPATVLDIGELDSGASAVSAPILSAAGIAQLSPGSAAVKLTAPAPPRHGRGRAVSPPTIGSVTRTFLRLDASDAGEAAAELLALHQAGCSQLGIVAGPDAGSYPGLLYHEASSEGLRVAFRTTATADLGALGKLLKQRGARCVALAAASAPPLPAGSATLLADFIHQNLPQAMIMGTPGLCDRDWTDAFDGGVQAAVDPFLRCTQPTLPVRRYHGGAAVIAAYEHLHDGHAPTPGVVLGYTAMTLGLDAIQAAGGHGDDRGAVLRELVTHRPRSTALGPVAFDIDGNAIPVLVGLYEVQSADVPVYLATLSPRSPSG